MHRIIMKSIAKKMQFNFYYYNLKLQKVNLVAATNNWNQPAIEKSPRTVVSIIFYIEHIIHPLAHPSHQTKRKIIKNIIA